jgi:troponin T
MADAADDAKRKEELNASLKEYIAEWRKTREAEEDELAKLKEKQAKRKEIRAEQEKKLNAAKKEEEEKMKKEEAERKAKEAEEKKKRLEEAEAKRQEMLDAQKAQKADANEKKKSVAGGPGNDARKELSKTKEQLEEEKKIALSIRIKPLELEAMDSDEMKSKAEDLFKTIVQLETDKYDYEQRKLTQELDLKELKERQKAQLRAKALKKGLDPEALTGKYPPKIRMYSKYERRTDTRSYDDRKKMYEGGWEVVRAEHLEASWKENHDEWSKRPSKKLPKWFGERPGKKAGAPETPEGEEEAEAAAPEEEDYDEEEEEEEEYDEEEE